MIVLILVTALFFLYHRFLKPSGDIDRYSTYYVNDTSAPTDGTVKVTSLGTTSLLFDDGETQLLTDGFITRPSLRQVTTSKIATDTGLVDATLAQLHVDRLKALFVVHTHYDHAFDSAYIAKHTGAPLYGSPSALNIGRGGGLRDDQMVLYQPRNPLHYCNFTETDLNSRHTPPPA